MLKSYFQESLLQKDRQVTADNSLEVPIIFEKVSLILYATHEWEFFILTCIEILTRS